MFAKCQVKQIKQIFLLQDSLEPLICYVMLQEAEYVTFLLATKQAVIFSGSIYSYLMKY